MTQYVVLLPGDERAWAEADAQTRRRVYASGFHLVGSDDLDDLLDVCGLLAGAEGVEVRAAVTSSDPEATR